MEQKERSCHANAHVSQNTQGRMESASLKFCNFLSYLLRKFLTFHKARQSEKLFPNIQIEIESTDQGYIAQIITMQSTSARLKTCIQFIIYRVYVDMQLSMLSLQFHSTCNSANIFPSSEHFSTTLQAGYAKLQI